VSEVSFSNTHFDESKTFPKTTIAVLSAEQLPKDAAYIVDNAPQTAEQVNGPQVGECRVDFEAMKAQGITSAQLVGKNPKFEISPNIALAFESVAEMLDRMRDLRDTGAFKSEGFHSFREWCMAKFGERIGGWVEDML